MAEEVGSGALMLRYIRWILTFCGITHQMPDHISRIYDQDEAYKRICKFLTIQTFVRVNWIIIEA